MNKDNISAGIEYLPKVKAIYQAVFELFEEGADLNSLTVSEITKKAGIGKGTAYEYFSDKEEMIAKAIFYNVEMFCQKINEGVAKEKSLYDKINFVLLTMERQAPHVDCLFRLIHIVSSNLVTSSRFREVVEQQRRFSESPSEKVVKGILEDVLRNRSIGSEEKKQYLVMSIYSKMLCYGMLLNEKRCSRIKERDTMRALICRGVCKEVEEIEKI